MPVPDTPALIAIMMHYCSGGIALLREGINPMNVQVFKIKIFKKNPGHFFYGAGFRQAGQFSA
jgi:hypothetical protein